MTTNTPTPAPDLDARVAALSNSALKIAEAVQNKDVIAARRAKAELEQAIRTELQKPALHEPVSDQETIDAIRTHHLKVTTESMIDMRRTLESFLQGRAKPAQEEITDAEILTAAGDWAVSLMGPVHLLRICRQVFNFRASKGEKM